MQEPFGTYRQKIDKNELEVFSENIEVRDCIISLCSVSFIKKSDDLTIELEHGKQNTALIENKHGNPKIEFHDTHDHTLATSFLEAIGVDLPRVISVKDEALVFIIEETIEFLVGISDFPNKKELISKEIRRVEQVITNFLSNSQNTRHSQSIIYRLTIANLSKKLFLMMVLDKNIDVKKWDVLDKFFDKIDGEKFLNTLEKVTIESKITKDFFSEQDLAKYKPLVDELNLLLSKFDY